MNFLMYLKQPFPRSENNWKTIFTISVFVPLFLYVFEPFGISQIDWSLKKNLFLAGYGIVTFIILFIELIIIERSFHSFFKEKNWSIYKEFLWLVFVIFSLGLANVTYTLFVSGKNFSFLFFLKFQMNTLAIAVFPITVFIISKQNYLSKKHRTSAEYVNNAIKTESAHVSKDKLICLYSHNLKSELEFEINNLCFIESKGNDIEINLISENKLVQYTMRNTLKKTLEYFSESPEIIQCHRAFIVNSNKIENIKGNSQGLELKIKNCEIKIPVSRSFIAVIRNKFS